MDIGLVVALAFSTLVGIVILLCSKRIGHFIYTVRAEIRDSVAPSSGSKWRKLVTWHSALVWGDLYYVWLIRIVGIGFVAGSLVALAIALSS